MKFLVSIFLIASILYGAAKPVGASYLNFKEQASISTPSANFQNIYVKSSDNKLYIKNSAGTESLVAPAVPVTVANGGTGLTTLTSNNVLLGAGTSNVTFVAPGTSGNVLTSNGTTWTSAAAAGGGAWGGITGTLSDQTDLNTALGLKAPLASPTFTGSITAPAGSVGTPSINFGDANTGIYATAVDTLDFSTGGTRRWTIDSSGHLTNNSAGTRIDFGGSNYISASGGNVNFYGGNTNNVSATNIGLLLNTSAGIYSSSDGAAQGVFTTIGRVTAFNSTSAIKRFHSIDASNRLRVGGTGTNGILYGGALSVTAPADYGYNNLLTYGGASTSTPTIVATALPSGVAFQFGVGDYINLDGGTNRRITGISGNVLTLDGTVGDGSAHTVYTRYPIASMRDRNGVEKLLIDPDGDHFVTNNLSLTTAGSGFKIKEGSNATMGVATLVGGTVTVSTTKVTASSRIFLTHQNNSGTIGFVTVSARTASTSFVITSSNGSDTSDIAWVILEPAS